MYIDEDYLCQKKKKNLQVVMKTSQDVRKIESL